MSYLTEKRRDAIFIGKINGNKGRKIHQQLNEKYLTLSFAIVSKFFGRVSTNGYISSWYLLATPQICEGPSHYWFASKFNIVSMDPSEYLNTRPQQ